MDIYRAQFGKRLREARKRIPGLTQERLAEKVGVEGPTVSRWETGKDFPEDHRLPTICKAVGVSEDYFSNPEKTKSDSDITLSDLARMDNRIIELLEQRSLAQTQDELTTDERQLLDLFRRVPEVRRQAALDALRIAAGSINEQAKPSRRSGPGTG